MVQKSAGGIDSLLESLLLEPSDSQAEDLIVRLIVVHAEPIIRGIIRYKLHTGFHQAAERNDCDDIYQDVLVQLLSELRQLRQQPDDHPITDLRGMAAIIAHRTCSRWLRRQFPHRHALKNRLYYVLTRRPELALWQDQGKTLVAGFAAWQGQPVLASRSRLRELSDCEGLLAQVRFLNTGKQHELAGVLAAMFNLLGGPVDFDELVTTIAGFLQVRDQAIESTDQNLDAVALKVAAAGPDPAWQVEKRMFLQRLWEELRQLPLNQRASLLLNLKDPAGGGCIALFPITGIASVRQLAGALEIPAETFAGLWNELPLEDARIAEILGLTRQQVINARKSGRERLARRLKGFI